MNKIVMPLMLLFLSACGVQDEKRIIGKWQSGDEWYEYFDDHTYNAGRVYITMVSHYKYSLDPNKHELSMYTDNAQQTYYLQYKFAGSDTLLLNNVLNSKTNFVKFYRIKK